MLACLLALLLLGLYLLPGTPVGRSWLLSQLEPRLEHSGISLSYGSSRGNLWHGLTLDAVTVTMPGAVLELDQLHISYALPALLTGRLPLSVAISGLQGDLTLSELALPQGSGGGLWVRPVLRDLDINEVALNINDIPYTLPNLSLTDFRAQDHGDTIAVDTTLATAAGQVEVAADVTLEPFTLTADIKKAAVRVARHWWAGAEGGTLSGSLQVRGGEVSADLTLADGAVKVAGLEVTHIHGEVHYQHPIIETTLTGTALGGPVTATGTVDIGARHWQGEADGSPQLAEVASWLAEGRLPTTLGDVDIEDFVGGSVETSLTLSGWRHVRLAGLATGEGRLLGKPLEHLEVTYAYDSTRGTQVMAEASYAGAPLDVALEPRADGFYLKVSGSDVPLNEQLVADVTLELTEGDEGLSGDLDTTVTGTVVGRALELSLDGHLGADGLQLYVVGQDEFGAYLTGAGVLQAGRLEAQLNVQGLSLPLLSTPVSVTAATSGALATLPLSIEVDAPEPLYLQIGGLQLENDLRGTLSTMLDLVGERRLTDISGQLGALELTGSLNLSERTGKLAYSLAPSLLSGPLPSTVQLQNGVLTLRESALQSQAKLVTDELSFGALRLSPLAANVTLKLADGLSLELQDSAKGLRVTLAEGVVNASFEETTLELNGQTIVLDGSLSHDLAASSWGGKLTLMRGESAVTLMGNEESLDVAGELAIGAVEASLAGTLRPEVELEGSAQTSDQSLQFTGQVTDGSLSGELLLKAHHFPGDISVATQQLLLSGSFDDGLQLSVTGEALNATFADGSWSGTLALPVQISGERHLISGDLTGALAAPQLQAEVSGAYVEGSFGLSREGGTAALQVDLSPWLPAEFEGLTAARATLNATADAKLDWTLDLSGTAALRELPLQLEASIAGERLSYRGSGSLHFSGETIPLNLSGEGGDFSVSTTLDGMNLASLSSILPFAVTGSASGQAVLSHAADGFSYRADLSLAGTFAGQTGHFELTAGSGESLSLVGTLAGVEVALTETGAGDAYTLSLQDSAHELALQGQLTLGEVLSLTGSGTVRGEAFELEATYNPVIREASWQAQLGEAQLVGKLEPSASSETLLLSSSFKVPAGSLGARALSADLVGRWQAGALYVDGLTAQVGEGRYLSLSGRAWPQPELTGELTLTRLDAPLALSFVAVETGYTLTAEVQGLTLQAALAPDFTVQSVQTNGSYADEAGRTLSTNLTWAADAGFAEQAELGLSLTPDAKLNLTLMGAGGLNVKGQLVVRDATVATVDANLSRQPWRDRSLAGTVTLDASVAALLPNWPAGPLTLGGRLALGGTLSEPTLGGPVHLAGAIDAAGTVQLAAGELGLELEGENLTLSAAVNAQGWRLDGVLHGLMLADLLPQVDSPQLSAQLSASQSWGEALTMSADNLRLQTLRSLLSGRLSYDGTWQGRLELSANLADIKLADKELRGTLAGPISLSSRPGDAGPLGILAQLEAESIGVQGSDWLLSGDVTLTGTLSDPQVSVSLNGGGSASGELYVFAKPRAQHYQLSSDLQVGHFSSDMRLMISKGEVGATGNLSWQDYRLSLAEASTPDAIRLVGEGKLAGWQGLVDVAAQRLSLQGELTTLAAQLRGALELNYQWADSVPTPLTGHIEGMAVGSIPLGDVSISSSGGTVSLTGERLDATVMLDDGVSWDLARLELPLSQSLTLTASGAGTFTEASLQTRLKGSLAGQALELPIDVTYEGGRLQLGSESGLLGGAFALHAAYSAANGWTGKVSLMDASLGTASLTAEGILYGELSQPQLYTDLSVTAEHYQSSGTLTLSQGGVRLEQQLTVTGLQAPLNIAGVVYPQLELSLNSGVDDGLYLATAADGLPTATGRLALDFGAATLTAGADSNGTELLTLTMAGGLPGLALETILPRLQPSELFSYIQKKGLTLTGVEATTGTLTVALADGLSASLDNLRWQGDVGTLSLTGSLLQQDGLSAELSGHWQGSAATTGEPATTEATPPGFLPWLSELQELPFAVNLQGGHGQVTSTSALGTVKLQVDLQKPSLLLNADLSPGNGHVQATLTYDAETGVQGEVKLEQLPLLAPSETMPALSVSGTVHADSSGLSGDVNLTRNGSSVSLQGNFGWFTILPNSLHAYVPASSDMRQLELRVDSFNLASLPSVQRRLPYLDAPLTGVVRLQGNNLVGQLLSPELSVLDKTLPTQLEFNGAPFGADAAVAVRASLGESRAELSYDGRVLSGLIKLEQFPLEVLGEAIIGESAVSASVTAIARLELPLLHPAQGVVRFASERLILERGGIVTEGQLALQYLHGNLVIDQAEFSGAGTWHAEGQISPERLEFSLTATDADFSPLLGLVPPLAALDIGARGSLSLRASNAHDPEVTLQSSGLNFSVGGSSYHLDDLEASLQSGQLRVSAQMRGVSPVGGRLNLAGGGPLQLFPFDASGLSFSFAGHAQVPAMGQITDIQGEISATAAGWQLNSRGLLGQPFTLSGSLAPLDLRLGGQRLQVSAPRYYLAESSLDAALRLRYDEAFILSGTIRGHEARLELGRSEQEQAADAQDAQEITEAGTAPQGAPHPLLKRIIFSDIRISMPQQISIQENFGSAELGLDVTLSGSAARPQLDGEARALRGSFSFSGRDFRIDAAVATFEPTQGIYPSLHIEASTRFEKQQVLAGGAAGLEFAAPRGSSSFTVFLNLDGSFEVIEVPSSGLTRKLQLNPTLSSNARIQGSGEAVTFAPRPLTEDELLALLTLGKLEPGTVMGNFAGSAALSAVDTALDLFILSELQNLLGDAFGLDLFEFRTTSLGSLISGDEDSFGVSLRIGGYLSEELFASYRISSNDSEQYALSNEFGLRYDLGPLELKLETGINFLTESLDPVSTIGVSLGYAITPLIDISAGSNISSAGNSNFNLGLDIRW